MCEHEKEVRFIQQVTRRPDVKNPVTQILAFVQLRIHPGPGCEGNMRSWPCNDNNAAWSSITHLHTIDPGVHSEICVFFLRTHFPHIWQCVMFKRTVYLLKGWSTSLGVLVRLYETLACTDSCMKRRICVLKKMFRRVSLSNLSWCGHLSLSCHFKKDDS